MMNIIHCVNKISLLSARWVSSDVGFSFSKKAFSSKAVLTIAYRLMPIAKYDRTCVLDAGMIVELGSSMRPWEGGGTFRSLRNKTGSVGTDFQVEREISLEVILIRK
jgi:hypothetical protein